MTNDRKRSNPKISPKFSGRLRKQLIKEDDGIFNPEGTMPKHQLKETASVQLSSRDRNPVRRHRR